MKSGMDKNEYLAQLRAMLTGRMAPEELERILTYYEEYFDEAGPADSARVAEELGSPAELAHRVLGHAPVREDPAPPQPRERRGLGALWTALLALCAAPIALPLILAAVVVVVSLALAVILLVLGVCGGGVICAAVGLYVSVRSFTLLFQAGMTTVMYYSGLGMLTAGIGLLLITGSLALAGLCFRGMAALLRRMLRRREVQA